MLKQKRETELINTLKILKTVIKIQGFRNLAALEMKKIANPIDKMNLIGFGLVNAVKTLSCLGNFLAKCVSKHGNMCENNVLVFSFQST